MDGHEFSPINGWTKASMIEFVKENFKGQSVRGGDCLYRGPHGTKCAAGLFIPDELYDKKMEDTTIFCVLDAYPKLAEFMPLGRSGMSAFQEVHDQSSSENCLENMINFINERVEGEEKCTTT